MKNHDYLASGTQGLKCDILRTWILSASWFGSAHLCVLAAFLDSKPLRCPTFKPTGRGWVSLSHGSSALIGLAKLRVHLRTNHGLQDVGL